MKAFIIKRFTWILPLLTGLAVTLTVWPAQAQPGDGLVSQEVSPRPQIATIEPTGRVAELIGRLANESPDQRQAAAHSLLQMGLAVEPQVRWALQREEERHPALYPLLRTQSVRSVLDPNIFQPQYAFYELKVLASHLEEMRHSETSIISLHYTNAPWSIVLTDLGRQADARMAVAQTMFNTLDWFSNTKATVNCERATYWQALQAIEQSGGLGEYFRNLNNVMFIQGGFGVASPAPYATLVKGPLQISVIPMEAPDSWRDPVSNQFRTTKLGFYARAEPKLSNSGRRAMVRLDECVDDQGQSLLSGGPRSTPSIEDRQYWYWRVPAEVIPPAEGRSIKTLKGQFSVALMMGQNLDQSYLSLTNVMHAQGKSRGFDGLRVTVSQTAEKDDYYEVDFDISAPAGSPWTTVLDGVSAVHFYDSAGHELMLRRMTGPWMQLEPGQYEEAWAARGTRMPEAGWEFHGVRHEGERDIASWRTLFSKRDRPETLIWRTPEETRWLTVPFEFHDLKVPAPQ